MSNTNDKNPNGVLITSQDNPRAGHLWVNKDGVLHLEVKKVMSPVLMLVIGKPIHLVDIGKKKERRVAFIRAQDFIDEFPDKREIVEKIAKKHNCKL